MALNNKFDPHKYFNKFQDHPSNQRKQVFQITFGTSSSFIQAKNKNSNNPMFFYNKV